MPRSGPRKLLLAARIDATDKGWTETRANDEEIEHPDFIRRMVKFARIHMPLGWLPPPDPEPETETPSEETPS